MKNSDIVDVAKWFLSKSPMTVRRLQILCYYAQAWSVTINNRDIANNCEFIAWGLRPTNIKLQSITKKEGFSPFDRIRLKSSCRLPRFKDKDIKLLESVWLTYKECSDDVLEMQVTSEHPWERAKLKAEHFESPSGVISRHDMREYYGLIYNKKGE